MCSKKMSSVNDFSKQDTMNEYEYNVNEYFVPQTKEYDFIFRLC